MNPDEPLRSIETDADHDLTKNKTKRCYEDYAREENDIAEDQTDSQQTERSFVSTLSVRHSSTRREAYFQMLENARGEEWMGIGLLSTDGGHSIKEKEL